MIVPGYFTKSIAVQTVNADIDAIQPRTTPFRGLWPGYSRWYQHHFNSKHCLQISMRAERSFASRVLPGQANFSVPIAAKSGHQRFNFTKKSGSSACLPDIHWRHNCSDNYIGRLRTGADSGTFVQAVYQTQRLIHTYTLALYGHVFKVPIFRCVGVGRTFDPRQFEPLQGAKRGIPCYSGSVFIQEVMCNRMSIRD